MGNKIANNKKSHKDMSKKHKQDYVDANGQEYAVIADKTAAAIATQRQPLSVAKNGSLTPNGPPPSNQQQPPPEDYLRHGRDYSRARALMLFPTSGHMGFDIIKMSDELPPIETIREMIAYETCIRLCEPIQELIDIYHTDEAAVA